MVVEKILYESEKVMKNAGYTSPAEAVEAAKEALEWAMEKTTILLAEWTILNERDDYSTGRF